MLRTGDIWLLGQDLQMLYLTHPLINPVFYYLNPTYSTVQVLYLLKRHLSKTQQLIPTSPQENHVYTPNAPMGFYPMSPPPTSPYPKAPFTSYPTTSYSTKSPFPPHTSPSWPTRVMSVISDTHRWAFHRVQYFPFSAENFFNFDWEEVINM